MKLGFTGTRENVTDAQKSLFRLIVWSHWPEELHMGCCVGADEFAAIAIGTRNAVHTANSPPHCRIVGHPPKWTQFLAAQAVAVCDKLMDPLPYLVRNQNIVDATESLIAMPNGVEVLRSGTWSTVRYARKLKRPIFIIYPDGTSRVEDKAGTVFA